MIERDALAVERAHDCAGGGADERVELDAQLFARLDDAQVRDAARGAPRADEGDLGGTGAEGVPGGGILGGDGAEYCTIEAAMSEPKLHERPFADDIEAVLRMRAKVELRRSVQRIRSTTPSAAKHARSEAIRTRLRASGAYEGARSIALFRPIARKGEVDTGGIDEDARAAGLRVAYPILDEPEPEPPTMSFRWVDAPTDASFAERGHGFPEPTSTDVAGAGEIDVVVVPGLAFDPEGNRLGYGAGFYDRFLVQHRLASPHGRVIGICFDFQVLVEIPITPHDVPVSTVITDVRTFVRAATTPRSDE
ncbi:MAG: 5-formyltetrahydrofolate cyclo-ligase [Polyangiales bacterium]